MTKMMMSAAVVALCAGGAASAASLSEYQAVAGGQTASVAPVSVDYSGGYLTATDADFASPLSLQIGADGSITLDPSLDTVSLGAIGAETFGGQAEDAAGGANMFRVLLKVSDSFTAQWGDWAIAKLSFADDSGVTADNALTGGVPGFIAPLSATLTVRAAERVGDAAPVPLPAGAVLLMTGMMGLGALRRRA